MAVQRFEDLIVWRKSQDFTVDIYRCSDAITDRSFRDQLRRAALSISNNIAEGFGRRTDKDFIRFLYFSLGSASEVKSMAYLSVRLMYISVEIFDEIVRNLDEISKMLHALIRSMMPK